MKNLPTIPNKTHVDRVDKILFIKDLCTLATDYLKVREENKTERKRIEEQARACIEKIRAHKEIIIKALELRFEDRKNVFDKLFNTLEKFTEKENNEAINLTLMAIAQQIKINPLDFKGFLENFDDKSEIIEI